MFNNKCNGRHVLLALALSMSASVAFADNCGEIPQAPELVKGASSTMEELVANSESVKAYIASADTFLDCRDAYAKTDEFKGLNQDEQKALIDTSNELLAKRNAIGDNFNKEVAAFKAANP
ncbi:MAG: hypothetical protein M0Q95_01310 [Porticoccaceae bacterium]|jgi:hypothetical protein|nr:hypothetical protein [Porticoccaceae bacterium]